MSTTFSIQRPIDAVVIGSSAGGLEALSIVLPALRPDNAAAAFVVLHIPRDRPSRLVEVLEPKCSCRVVEAEDKDPIQAGTIYIAPPDYHLLVDAGPAVALSSDAHVNFARPSIDVLFESASEVYGRRLLGIVLTGANSDGAEGLAAVKRAGGLALVQDPSTASASAMPAAALARTDVDCVMTLQEISSVLRKLNGDAK